MKNLKSGFAISGLIACVVLLFLQHQALEKLRAENQLLMQQTSQLSAEDKFQLHEWHMINAMKELCLAMRIFAEDHDKLYATNFIQLSAEFGPSDIIKDKSGNFLFASDKIAFNSFEFVNTGQVDASTTNAIIFREKVPRVAPNGWWYRIYGLADGEVESVFGDDQGDEKKFIEYERQHSPPPNQ
jgi:hypothetical protein